MEKALRVTLYGWAQKLMSLQPKVSRAAAPNRAGAPAIAAIARPLPPSPPPSAAPAPAQVQMTEHLIDCGLCLFKYLRRLQVAACAAGRFPHSYLADEDNLVHDLVACWWVALKHCSVRTAVPNRTLMARATGATPELLSDRELAALIGMDWDVNAVLRLSGLTH
jgi:hypothetical protein